MTIHRPSHHAKAAYRISSRGSSSTGSSWSHTSGEGLMNVYGSVDRYVPYYAPRAQYYKHKRRPLVEARGSLRWSDEARWERDGEYNLPFRSWSSCLSERSSGSSFSSRSNSLSRYSDNAYPTPHSSQSSSPGVVDFMSSLYVNPPDESNLSTLLDSPRVFADYFRREHHSNMSAARMYNLHLPWVREMIKHMHDAYDTVSCYSLGLLPAGTIIYYLSPFLLTSDQPCISRNTISVGGEGGARVHLKGRFGIVLDTYEQHAKIVEMSTFGKQGLKVKPQTVWHEYVGVRMAEDQHKELMGMNEALGVEWSCCAIRPESAAHLLPDKVGLNSHILIAGNITEESLGRLKSLVRALD